MIRKKKRNKEFLVLALTCLICLSALAVGTHLAGNREKNKEDKKNIIKLNNENDKADKNNLGDTLMDEKSSNKNLNDDTNNSEIETEDVKEAGYGVNKYEPDRETDYDFSTEDKNTQIENYANENKSIEEGSNTGQNNEESDISKDENIRKNALVFDEAAGIKWPVSGNVILDYSMDKTIYFPTLNVYKCNPAIVIQSEPGKEVILSVSGRVLEVSSNAEIGNYVIVDIGSGYELTFGQLDSIKVSEGTELQKDTVLGLIGEPTRFYTNEGPNLYLKMTKDKKSCNPIDFLK